MNELSEIGQGSGWRCIEMCAPRPGKGRWCAMPRRMRSVHRKSKKQFVLNQIDQRQGVALDPEDFPALASPIGPSFGADDEHVDRGVEIDFEGLEASLTGQPNRNLQAAADAGPPRCLLPEFQVHPHRKRRTVHRLKQAMKPADREGAAEAFSPGGEQNRIAESGQHKRLMLLRWKTRCQSEEAAGYRRERIHSGP